MKKIILTLIIGLFALAGYTQILTGNTVTKILYVNKIVGTDSASPRSVTGIIEVDTLLLPSGEKFWRIPDTASIYTLINTKLDSVTQTGDSIFFYANGTLNFTTLFARDTNTLQQVLNKGNTSTTGFFVNASSAIGSLTADPSAILNLESTSKGFLIPRMTTAQRLAISSPTNGLVVYDTDFGLTFKRVGDNWIEQ